MGASVKESTIEVVVEQPSLETEAAAVSIRSHETEADRIRRQMMVRRKTKLARHALMARRTR